MWIRPVGQRHHRRAAGLYRQYYSQYVRGGRSDDRGYLGLSAGLNVASWRVRHDGSVAGIARRLALSTGPAVRGDRHPVLEIRTAVGRDIFRWAVLRPGFVSRRARGQRRTHAARRTTQHVPTIRGTAQTNATVSVYQRGFLVHETTVAAGPFVIEDLQAASYGGDLRCASSRPMAKRAVSPCLCHDRRAVEVRRNALLDVAGAGHGLGLPQRRAGGVRRPGAARPEQSGYGIRGLALSGNYRSVLLGAVLNTEWGALAGDITAATAKLANEKHRAPAIDCHTARICPRRARISRCWHIAIRPAASSVSTRPSPSATSEVRSLLRCRRPAA